MRKRPDTGALPNCIRLYLQATTLVGRTYRTLLELAIGIARGFIASGISRTRSMCRSVRFKLFGTLCGVWNGGSGSFGFEIRRLSTDVAIVAATTPARQPHRLTVATPRASPGHLSCRYRIASTPSVAVVTFWGTEVVECADDKGCREGDAIGRWSRRRDCDHKRLVIPAPWQSTKV
jgi:hypothetical protein